MEEMREWKWETYNDHCHAGAGFAATEHTRRDEDNDCDWDGGDGEPKLGIISVLIDDDDKLDGETKEEEKVELEEGDVNLSSQSWSKIRNFMEWTE